MDFNKKLFFSGKNILIGGNTKKAVGVLAGGTAISQLIAIISLPILTRIYSPADFETLAFYISIVAMISVVACLRYEIAIPLPESEKDAIGLLIIAFMLATTVSSIVLIVVIFISDAQVKELGLWKIKDYLILIPLGVWICSVFSAVQFWATRTSDFKLIAKTKVSQSALAVVVQTMPAWFIINPIWLICGYLISSGAFFYFLLSKSILTFNKYRKELGVSYLLALAKRYERLPKYSTWESLANVAAYQIPILVISTLAFGAEAGYLMLALRVMQAPMSMIGGAISQVYQSRAPHELRKNTVSDYTSNVLTGIIKYAVGPLIFAGIVAQSAFSLIFGPDWARAGEVVLWITPWMVLQLMSSPISMIMHITDNQRGLLRLTIFGLLVRGLGLAFAIFIFNKAFFTELYAVSSAIFYFICFFVFYKEAGVKASGLLKVILSYSWILLMWVLLGVIFRFSLVLI